MVLNRGEDAPATKGNKKRVTWDCICDCGNFTNVRASALRKGATQSCGCYKIEVNREIVTTHGMSRSKAYRSYTAMHTRVTNPNVLSNKYYKHLTIHPQFMTFEGFYEVMGDPPGPEYSIERIDVNQGYSPENCKWATPKEQARNKRNSRLITIDGVTHCAAEWCEIYNIPWDRFKMRTKRGWSDEDALKTPITRGNKYVNRGNRITTQTPPLTNEPKNKQLDLLESESPSLLSD